MLPSFSHVSMKYNVGDRVRASDGQLWVVVDPAYKRLKCYKHRTKSETPCRNQARKKARKSKRAARRKNRK